MKNKTFIAALCLLALPAWGLAQSFLLQGPPPDGKLRVTLRYFWPQAGPDDDNGPDILSGLYDLSIDYRVLDRLQLAAALPYIGYRDSFVNWEQERTRYSAGGLGCVSIALRGILKQEEDRSTSLTAGVYLPTMGCSGDGYSECGALFGVGLLADFPEFPKVMDVTTPFVRVSHYQVLKGGWRAGLEGGAFIMMARGGGTRPLYAQAGVSIGRSVGPVDLTAEWIGTMKLSGFVDEFYFHLYHQAGIGASWGRGRLRPGIFYTMFLDRFYRESSRGAFGIKLSYAF